MNHLVRVLLAVVLLGLLAWDRSLDTAADAEGVSSERLGRLVGAEEREALQVAALSLEHQGQVWTYARLEGTWRCLEHHQAVASDALVQRLVNDVLEAEGVTHSDRPERFGEYGVSEPGRWRLRLHGAGLLRDADRDTRLTVDIGRSVEALGGCFVRRPERNLVWAVDKDLTALVEGSRVGASPPLLDPHVVPGSWPPSPARLSAVTVRRADGARVRLELRGVELTPEELQAGAVPFSWMLVGEDGSETEVPPMHAVGFTVFLQRLPWEDLAPSSEAPRLGLERLTSEVVLETDAGQSLALRAGEPLPDGRVAVACSLTRMISLVGAETARLMAPDGDTLLTGDPAGRNPWESVLQR